jgi:hypothetical protein
LAISIPWRQYEEVKVMMNVEIDDFDYASNSGEKTNIGCDDDTQRQKMAQATLGTNV